MTYQTVVSLISQPRVVNSASFRLIPKQWPTLCWLACAFDASEHPVQYRRDLHFVRHDEKSQHIVAMTW